MERSEEKKNGEPHYFTFEVSWEVANKGIFLIKTLLTFHLFAGIARSALYNSRISGSKGCKPVPANAAFNRSRLLHSLEKLFYNSCVLISVITPYIDFWLILTI